MPFISPMEPSAPIYQSAIPFPRGRLQSNRLPFADSRGSSGCFGLVGGAIGYFVDAGPNRIGLGLLIGMAFGAIFPFFQLWGAAYYPTRRRSGR